MPGPSPELPTRQVKPGYSRWPDNARGRKADLRRRCRRSARKRTSPTTAKGGKPTRCGLDSRMLHQTIAMLLAVSGPITESKSPWFQIGFGGGGFGASYKAHVSFQRVTGLKVSNVEAHPTLRWEADLYTESSDYAGKLVKVHQRADGRSCPGVSQSLRSLASIPALKPQAPEGVTEQSVPFPPPHGSAFFFNRYGRIAGSSALYSESFGDPSGRLLQPIWNTISAALKPCWADVADGAL